MKDLKKKLTAAAAMLVVSAVMLSGVSYAWYTLSTNPEVTGITATAVANQNLEIALMKDTSEKSADVDARSGQTVENGQGVQGSTTSNYYTWGNLIDLSNIIDSTKAELRPAQNSNNQLKYPTYGADGRINAFQDLTAGTYEADKEGVAYESANNKNYAVRVDYWLKTNTAGKISLSTAAKRDNTNDTTVTGDGSYISSEAFKTGGVYAAEKDAIKVLFKVTKPGDANPNFVEATNTLDATSGRVTLAADIIDSAEANTAYQVTMYVYQNGNVVTNAMANAAINDLSVNVQFNNAAIADANAAMSK